MNDHKYCPSCGEANPSEAAFCANCGKQFGAASVTGMPPAVPPSHEPPYYEPIEPPKPPRRFKKRYVLYGVVGLFVLLIVAAAASPPSSNSAASPVVHASVTATPTAHKVSATPKATPAAQDSETTLKIVDVTDTPAATPEATATPSGQGTASTNDFSMAATDQGGYTSTNQFIQPSAGNKYVQIYVEVTNKDAKDALMGNQFQFKLFDNKNIGHAPATASFGAPNNMQSLDHSQPGDKVAGIMVFEIPAGNTPTKLVFEPGLFHDSLTVTF